MWWPFKRTKKVKVTVPLSDDNKVQAVTQTIAGLQGMPTFGLKSGRHKVSRAEERYIPPSPPPTQVSSDDSLLTGIVIGAALSEFNSPVVQDTPSPVEFDGFHGGESGGAGAGGSWEPDSSPVCDSSPVDSPSCCDSSSSGCDN